MFPRNKQGQSTLEYALLIAAVVAGLIMMQIYLKRGIGGRLKGGADNIGEQFDPVVFSSSYNMTSGSTRNETVSNGVTMSKLTAVENNTRSGNETVGNWTSTEDLYRGY
jgi:uncharacterized protein (UPF0333 family)